MYIHDLCIGQPPLCQPSPGTATQTASQPLGNVQKSYHVVSVIFWWCLLIFGVFFPIWDLARPVGTNPAAQRCRIRKSSHNAGTMVLRQISVLPSRSGRWNPWACGHQKRMTLCRWFENFSCAGWYCLKLAGDSCVSNSYEIVCKVTIFHGMLVCGWEKSAGNWTVRHGQASIEPEPTICQTRTSCADCMAQFAAS